MQDSRQHNIRTVGPYLSRRAALKFALAATIAGTSGLTGCLFDQGGLQRRKIPASGETLPIIGLGSSATFESGPKFDRSSMREVLRVFVELGGSLVDTSPTYGDAESNVGEIAHELDVRSDLFMATRVHAHGRAAGITQLERSEQRLGGPLDLVQVHNLTDVRTQLKTLRRWKDEGRIRYVGVSHYQVKAHAELEQLVKQEPLDFLQCNYSIMTPDAEKRLLPMAADHGVAVLINRPFNDGRLFQVTKNKPLPDWAHEFYCKTWAQFALKYILGNPAVTCALPATSKPYHLADNMSGGVGELPQDEPTRKRMRDVISSL